MPPRLRIGLLALRPPLARLAPAVALVACLLVAPVHAGYEEGTRVQLTGLVTDEAGQPLPELQVVLEASRTFFDVRHLRKGKKDHRRLSGLTNEKGEYNLEWPWNRYYNTYELLVGVTVRRPDGERLKVLERIDLSRKIQKGSPVVSAILVKDAAFVRNLRQFLSTLRSDDERRVHQEMGEPDKVERFEYPDRHEVTWWYFEAGRLYRFRDGALQRIEPFDPVKGL